MKKLITQRLYLIPFQREIVEIAILGNTELGAFLNVDVLPDWHDLEFLRSLPFIADILRNYPLQNEWGWGSLIIQQAEKALIGHVMVKIIPDSTGSPTGSLEIGYYIAPSHRQQGYAFEATKAVVDWALSQPNVHSVTAGCDRTNLASQRLLAKLGMELVESRKKILIWQLGKTATVK
ncbi:GNAT family N-acetyltransferase [Nostoc sp. FACHB-110]|uniref:GNAT family N-acetyltransferase n=1 Tax=Nostoc sp. FACHB-110 TaxID=2692834 RepID=UPI001683192D|nr:GNAT family N-acetyltransferase [Nostoc sp. FACHB-110]MBD2438928.1 GNAT family N-acetyltransferase [Nostoc sp. FACHB-110]